MALLRRALLACSLMLVACGGAVAPSEPCADCGRPAATSSSSPPAVPTPADPPPVLPTTSAIDPSDCLIGGSVMIVDGLWSADLRSDDRRLVSTWFTSSSSTEGVTIEVAQSNTTRTWSVTLETKTPPLTTGRHDGGLGVFRKGEGCNVTSGSYTVHEIEWNGDEVARLTATFEQLCSDGVVRGCVHYEP